MPGKVKTTEKTRPAGAYGMIDLEHWRDIAYDGEGTFSKPYRLAALAYYHAWQGGTVSFAPGELAWFFAVVDKKTGEAKADPQIKRSIETAVQKGWLEEGSTTRELIPNGYWFGTRKQRAGGREAQRAETLARMEALGMGESA